MSNKKKAKVLNLIGTLMMLIVVVAMIPLTVPKLFGYKLYGVLSGSMEPTLKKGGVVYVVEMAPEEAVVGDVISYVTASGTDIVTTHRITEITENGYFITKGDANNTVDPEPVKMSRMVGKAVFFIPYLGSLSSFIYTVKGICTAIMIFGVALALWIYASILSPAEKKEKVKKESKISDSAKFTIAGIVLVAGSLIGLGVYAMTYKIAEDDFDSIRTEFADNSGSDATSSTIKMGNNKTVSPINPKDLLESSMESRTESVSLAFEDLAKKYSNLVGWIQIPGTVIDYPVMHGSDDTFYLRHTYDGSYSRPGSIFLSADNAHDFSDRYNVIYGHNQNNGKMFSPLLDYDTEGFREEHPYIYLLTREGLRTYEIFSFFYVYPTDAMYTIKYYNVCDYDILVNNMAKVSRFETGVDVSEEDDILMLSTCNYNAKLRFVVCAKLLEDED